MSNQIGLILSFFFLTILISFSFEIINYQQCSAIIVTQGGQIAQNIQLYGYDVDKLSFFEKEYEDLKINIICENSDGIEKINIKVEKEYECITELFSFMENNQTYEVIVYRKEK